MGQLIAILQEAQSACQELVQRVEVAQNAIEKSQNETFDGIKQLHSMLNDVSFESEVSTIGPTASAECQQQMVNSLQQRTTSILDAGTTCGELDRPSSEESQSQRLNHSAPTQRDWIAAKFVEFRAKAGAFWALRAAVAHAVEERRIEALSGKVAAAHFAKNLRRRFQVHTRVDGIDPNAEQ